MPMENNCQHTLFGGKEQLHSRPPPPPKETHVIFIHPYRLIILGTPD